MLLLGTTSVLQAQDTLELRNGSSLKGVYEGGTPDVLHFNFNGTTQAYSRNDVASLTFAKTVPSQPTGSAPVSAPTPKPAPAGDCMPHTSTGPK